MEYYQKIKDIREDKDKTQKQIAEILQTTQQQYGRYEKGTRELPIRHLITLCKYYNISSDYILGLSNIPKILKTNNK